AIGVLPAMAIAHPALVVPLAAAPLGLIIMMRIPVWLVLGFVAFTFFRLHEAIPALLPLRIPQLLAIPTLVVLVWHIGIKQSIKPFWGKELTAFAVFFSLVTIGMPFATAPDIAINTWTSSYSKIAIMTLSIAWLLRKPGDFQLASWMIVGSGTIVAWIAISNRLSGIGLVEGTRVTVGRDIGSVLGDPNDLSLVLTFPLSFAVSMAVTRGGGINRLIGAIGVVTIIWAIMCTQSRGGILGILAVFAVVGLRLIKSKVALGAIGGIAMTGLFAVAGISDRASGGAAEEGIDESAMGGSGPGRPRLTWLWQTADRCRAQQFHSQFLALYPHWTGFNKAVHSTWLGSLQRQAGPASSPSSPWSSSPFALPSAPFASLPMPMPPFPSRSVHSHWYRASRRSAPRAHS
ncbi:MAG: hypothetical protein R3D29_15410, partial [Nitratireductor sp.]